VPVAKIQVPKVRVTAVYDEELQELLKSSLEAAGQIQPIVVLKTGEDLHLVDGLHRLQEAQERGDKTIPAVLYEGEAADTLLLNVVSNRLRGKTKASEMVQVIAELTETYKMDSDQIRAKTGLTRDYIERLWKIAEAAPGVIDALDREVIGVGVAFEIARLPTHFQQEELVATAQIWRWSTKEVKGFVDEVMHQMEMLEEAPPPTEPPPRRVPACEGCNATPEPRYLRPVLLCPNCFGYVFRMAKEREPTGGDGETPVEEGEGA